MAKSQAEMTAPSLKLLSLILLAAAAALHSTGWLLTETAWGALLPLTLAALWAAWLTLGHGQLPGALPFWGLALLLSGAGALWQSEAGVVWVYLGGVVTLAAWNLCELYGRLRQHAPYVANETELVNGRLRQLALFATLSLAALPAWALIPPTPNFDRVLLFTLLLLWALAYLLRRREETGD